MIPASNPMAWDVPPVHMPYVANKASLPGAAPPEEAYRQLRPRLMVRPTILVIDDDTALLQLLASVFALEIPDASVRLAATAHEGERSALSWLPKVILCDIQLPDEDGRHLLGRLRKRPGLAQVPGVLMTGLDVSSRLLREEACALRAELLRKPFELSDMLAVVERALSDQVAHTALV
jgi:two-component system sensor histidine kinase TorS